MADLSEKLAVIEKENADLKTSVAQKEGLAQENQQLRQRVQTLVEELNTLRPPSAPDARQGSGVSGY